MFMEAGGRAFGGGSWGGDGWGARMQGGEMMIFWDCGWSLNWGCAGVLMNRGGVAWGK